MKTWKHIACTLGRLLERETNDDDPEAPHDGLAEAGLQNEIESELAELRVMIKKDVARAREQLADTRGLIEELNEMTETELQRIESGLGNLKPEDWKNPVIVDLQACVHEIRKLWRRREEPAKAVEQRKKVVDAVVGDLTMVKHAVMAILDTSHPEIRVKLRKELERRGIDRDDLDRGEKR